MRANQKVDVTGAVLVHAGLAVNPLVAELVLKDAQVVVQGGVRAHVQIHVMHTWALVGNLVL